MGWVRREGMEGNIPWAELAGRRRVGKEPQPQHWPQAALARLAPAPGSTASP